MKIPATLIFNMILTWQILSAQQLNFKHLVIDKVSCSQARQIGDFNNDGKNDILIIEGEFKPTQFAWYEYPSWTKHDINNQALDSLFYVADCFVADLDNDGDEDVVFPDAHEGQMRVLWFENPISESKDPNIAWTEHIVGNLGKVSWLKDIEAADFNNDGLLDIAVRGQTDLFIFYQNNSNGWKQINFPVRPHEGLATADIDRDGFMDLVLNGFWLKNPKSITGTWTEHIFDPKWFNQKSATASWQDNNAQVRTGDMNDDGLTDIIIANSEKANYPVSWYVAPKDPVHGTWKENVIDQLDYCHTLQIADFDNNGSLDILAAEMVKGDDPDQMNLYLNSLHGKISQSQFQQPVSWKKLQIQNSGAYWAVAGDIGGDGDIGILSSRSYDTPPVEIWENTLNDKKQSLDKWTYIQIDDKRENWGAFEKPKWLRYFGISAADVNQDGYADIVSGRYCYLNPGGTMQGVWTRIDFGMNLDAGLVVDVDNDKNPDIIALHLPDVYWLESEDKGISWNIVQIARFPGPTHFNSQGLMITQIIPGGKPELIFEGGDGMYCIEIPASPESGMWPTTHISGKGTHAEGIGAGDIDGDGYIDLATGKGWLGVVWWKNPGDGSGNWTNYEVGTVNGDYVDKLAVADINGDGRKDIIAAEELYPGIEPAGAFWFEQPENPTEEPALFNWKRHEITSGKFTLNNMNAMDMDRDGDIDVVVAEHKGDKRTFVYENDGKGNFIEHLVGEGHEGHGGAFIFDLDNDGDYDIVNITWEDYNFLHLYRNDAIK